MFCNAKDIIKRILKDPYGFPEECAWIEYKDAYPSSLTRKDKEKLGQEVTAFLNCLQAFGREKFILFGIHEDKKGKTKDRVGLGTFQFPDDNEWQNVFSHIKPVHPTVETGIVDYQGLKFGYFYISADNYRGPYSYPKNGADQYWIRRGGSKFNMEPEEQNEFHRRAEEITQKGTIFSKTKESMVLSVIGQYVEENKYDQALVVSQTNDSFEQFQQRCIWQGIPIQREQSRYLSIPASTAQIDAKHERLAQFSPDDAASAMEIIRYVMEHRENYYSVELLEGVLDTLAFLSYIGFSHFAQKAIRVFVTMELVCDKRYGDRISYIAEIDPEFLLNLLQSNKGLSKHSKGTFIRALQTIAWFPEYYKEASRFLWELGGKDANGALYSLLRVESRATAACFSQKLDLIREIAAKDQELAFNILHSALNCNHMVYERGPVPQKYLRLFKWPQNVESAKLQTYYNELLDLINNDVDRILLLLPRRLAPFPYSNLNWLASCIEHIEPNLKDSGSREKLWDRLCNLPLEYSHGIPLESELRDRLIAIGQKFRPNDPDDYYRRWFRENSYLQLRIEDIDPQILLGQLAERQKQALLDLYKQGGIGRVISFLSTVPERFIRLPYFSLDLGIVFTLADDRALLEAFFDAPYKYGYYFAAKFHEKGCEWISDLGIAAIPSDQKAKLFCELIPDKEDLPFFDTQMGEDAKLYWSMVKPAKLWNCIESAFDAFERYGFLEKAFDLLSQDFGRLKDISPQWLFQRLMLLKDHQDINMPSYEFANIYHSLSHRMESSKLEELEKLSFDRYGDRLFANGVQELRPQVTFWRIANEPEFLLNHVKQIDGPVCFVKKLLDQCDAAPENIQNWLDGIDALCTSEPEDIRSKIEEQVGFLLYNHLERDRSSGHILDSTTAEALEHSEKKRIGFFTHAYYSFSGCHVNGRLEYDVKDREDAKFFAELADVQKANGKEKLAEDLHAYAKWLIASVESV